MVEYKLHDISVPFSRENVLYKTNQDETSKKCNTNFAERKTCGKFSTSFE